MRFNLSYDLQKSVVYRPKKFVEQLTYLLAASAVPLFLIFLIIDDNNQNSLDSSISPTFTFTIKTAI